MEKKMSSKMFERPIPGQSLTAEPKNRPYDNPPEISDPEEALQLHLTRLNDVDRLDAVMLLLQKGVDVQATTEGLLRSAVAGGIHSVDVSLIIAPAIHEYIVDVADEVGLDYKTGFEKDEQEEDREEMSLVTSILGKSEGKTSREPMSVDEPMEEEPEVEQMEMDLGAEESPKGLMARV